VNKYIAVYKPFNVLSQFTTEGEKKTLKDFFDVPTDVYPVGRLDYDSEGLLILTNDKYLNHQLLSPANSHEREYWVQVEGTPTKESMASLSFGVDLNIDGKPYRTKRCKAEIFTNYPGVPLRNPPIRVRKSIPDSWIRLTLTEGKNRQVRKMTAKVGLPTLRLIRYRIEKITIEGLLPGDIRMYSQKEMYNLLKIKNQ
jgi:23S rRNA pseudouridine2457 synthase